MCLQVIITPSRMILLSLELMVGNRVMREWDSNDERTLRIQFCDDNGDKLYLNRANELIDKTIGRVMND